MNVPRKVFSITVALLVLGTIVGIAVLTIMENQARAALPPEQQTAEAIATIYDGAVCLGCDLGRIFFGMFGAIAVMLSLLAWAVYEVGRVLMVRLGSIDTERAEPEV